MDRIPPPPNAAILDRNLEAFRAVDPQAAERLFNLELSLFNPVPAVTRDGRLSFRLTRPGQRTEWLGRTSVPGVRSAALMEQFDPGQGSILLPAFGEGTEVESLLKGLEPHRLVFVWEADTPTIRLVLALHDYAAALRAERLVILHCPAKELSPTLVDWLDRHPARQCPARIMMWPWQTQAEIDQVRSAVEAAWHQSCGHRQS